MQSTGTAERPKPACGDVAHRHRARRPRGHNAVATVFAILTVGIGSGTRVVGEEPETDDMTSLVQGTLAAGAAYLLDRIDETNGWTYALTPPSVRHGSRTVRTVTNYYSYKEVEVHIPEWETKTVYYEKYETLVQKPSKTPGAPPEVVKVTKRRRIHSPAEARNPRYVKKVKKRVRKKSDSGKTKTVRRLVRDKDGTVAKTRVIRKPGHADFWSPGFVGQNAMTLLALLKCGIPEDDVKVYALAESLNTAVLGYAPPDRTWDLAWLTAAFVHLDGEEFHAVRDILLNKLLDSQITDGKARGLWGPLCINSEMLKYAVAYHRDVMRKVDNPRDMDPDIEEALYGIGTICKRIACQGLRFMDVQKWYVLGLNELNPAGIDVIVQGLPYRFYTETFADIESTAIALFALHEAASKGVLPEAVVRPDDERGRRGRSWPRPDRTDAILARTASALSSLQDRSGQWPQCNIHQENEVLEDWDALSMMPAFEELELPDPTTPLSSARGAAALFHIGNAVGMDKVVRRYRRQVGLAFTTRRGLAEQYADGTLDLSPPPYCHFLPEQFVFHLAGLQRYAGTPEERDRALWQRLAVALAQDQTPDGSWETPYADYAVRSSSVWWQTEPRLRAHLAEQNAKLAARNRKTHSMPPEGDAFFDHWLCATKKHHYGRHPYWPGKTDPVLLDDCVATTCYAMLFLAEGFRPPEVAYIGDDAQTTAPKLLTAVTSNLAKRDELETAVLRIEGNQRETIQGRPVIFASTTAFLSSPVVKTRLRAALRNGATLMIDGAAAGQVKTRVDELVPGGRLGTIPAGVAWLQDWPGEKPRLQGVLRADGSVAVLLLPWAARATSGTLSSAHALQAAYLYTRHRIENWRRSDALDANPENLPDAMTMRSVALSRLETQAAPAPAEPVTEPTDTTPGPKPEAPAHRPAEDEVW